MNNLFLIAVSSAAEAEEKSGLAVLGLDPRAIALQAGTFLLLFLIVKKFVLGRIVKVLEDRRATIQEGLDNADKMRELMDETSAKQTKTLQAAHKQADTILARAHEDAGSIVQSAREQAELQAVRLTAEAEAQIAAAAEKAKRQIRNEAAELVADATEVILGEKLDGQRDRALLERALRAGKL